MALDENTKRQNMTDRERAEAEAALKAEMEKVGMVSRHGGDRTKQDTEQVATIATCSYADMRVKDIRQLARLQRAQAERDMAAAQASSSLMPNYSPPTDDANLSPPVNLTRIDGSPMGIFEYCKGRFSLPTCVTLGERIKQWGLTGGLECEGWTEPVPGEL